MGINIISGKYTSATIYTTNNVSTAIDDYAVKQLKLICDTKANEGSRIRVMPDVHPGKVGTIGLTMTVGNMLMPNLTGIDLGCGMSLIKIKDKKVEFKKLDTVIRESIPSGFDIRKTIHHLADENLLNELICAKHIDMNKALLSCGSLGSGNHFIEVDQDDEKNVYVVVHSGSRRVGKEITEYYLSEGQKSIKEKGIDIPYEMTYLTGNLLTDYLHDVSIAQKYASLNREVILSELAKGMKWKVTEKNECMHNYIDFSVEMIDAFNAPMLRKGAISAKEDEPVIIPINMKEGIILGTGLGNKDWNYSSPHGSGRIMKREDIKNNFTLSQFKKEMNGIYSPSINKNTLDEAPFAYRGLEDITEVIKDTVRIDKVIKPIYNFKAGGED